MTVSVLGVDVRASLRQQLGYLRYPLNACYTQRCSTLIVREFLVGTKVEQVPSKGLQPTDHCECQVRPRGRRVTNYSPLEPCVRFAGRQGQSLLDALAQRLVLAPVGLLVHRSAIACVATP